MPPNFDRKTFDSKSVYNIMLGPDLCGGKKSLHAILHYEGRNLNHREDLNPGNIEPPNSDGLTRKSIFYITNQS